MLLNQEMLRSSSKFTTLLWAILLLSLILNLSYYTRHKYSSNDVQVQSDYHVLEREQRDEPVQVPQQINPKQEPKALVERVNKMTVSGAAANNRTLDVFHGLVRELPFHQGRIDNRGVVRIFDFVWIGEQWDELLDSFIVCLATQGSMDRLQWIPQVINHWNGPLSLAIYVASPIEWVGLNLVVHHYKKCYPLFRDFVTLHVAIPAAIDSWSINDIDWNYEDPEAYFRNFDALPCEQISEVVKTIAERFKGDEDAENFKILYPQNHMRNIARHGCGTSWTFSTDADIVPSPDLAMQLQEFVFTVEVQRCRKCAYVIPTFELDESMAFPESKTQLVDYWKSDVARPFHFAVFIKGHNATNYPRWSSTFMDEERVRISHKADRNIMDFYEPFYLSPNTIPQFQERFIGYGFTRNSQVQEALAEGWTFNVLTPVFTIHWGLQSPNTLLSPGNDKKQRERQKYLNSLIFKRFKQELVLRNQLKKQEDYEKKHLRPPNFMKRRRSKKPS